MVRCCYFEQGGLFRKVRSGDLQEAWVLTNAMLWEDVAGLVVVVVVVAAVVVGALGGPDF